MKEDMAWPKLGLLIVLVIVFWFGGVTGTTLIINYHGCYWQQLFSSCWHDTTSHHQHLAIQRWNLFCGGLWSRSEEMQNSQDTATCIHTHTHVCIHTRACTRACTHSRIKYKKVPSYFRVFCARKHSLSSCHSSNKLKNCFIITLSKESK